MRGSIRHQAIDGFMEGYRCAEELYADEIPFTFDAAALVAHACIGGRRLAVEDETHRLDRFNGEWLMGFDQRAVVREIVHTHRVTRIERPPERAEYFETHAGSSIPGCFDAHRPSIPVTAVQSVRHAPVTYCLGKTR